MSLEVRGKEVRQEAEGRLSEIMKRLRQPLNRLVMLRARGVVGPMFQRARAKSPRMVHSAGNYRQYKDLNP